MSHSVGSGQMVGGTLLPSAHAVVAHRMKETIISFCSFMIDLGSFNFMICKNKKNN